MTTMRECVDYLAKEIGPRPAGTDEEQQAALYIKDIYEQETNLDVDLMEFSAPINGEVMRFALSVLVFLSAILAIATPSLVVASLIISLIAGVLFILGELGIFSVAQFLGRAPSQNVVAKFSRSGGEAAGRKKKIVVVTNYDSDKAKTEYSGVLGKYINYIKYFEVAGAACVILGALIAFLAPDNAFATFLFIVGIIGSAFPIVGFIFHKTAKFNEGANNNAASVAVMAEVAKRLATGVYAPRGEVPVIHGEAAAIAAGAIPEGAEVTWEGEATAEEPASEGSAQDKKASSIVASMMFSKKRAPKKEETPAQEQVEQEQVSAQEQATQPEATQQQAAQQVAQSQVEAAPVAQPVAQVAAPAPQPATPEPAVQLREPVQFTQPEPAQVSRSSSVPSWFSSAKKKAASNSPLQRGADTDSAANVKKSIYATALDATEAAQREQRGARDANNKQQSVAYAPASQPAAQPTPQPAPQPAPAPQPQPAPQPAPAPQPQPAQQPAQQQEPAPAPQPAPAAQPAPAPQPQPAQQPAPQPAPAPEPKPQREEVNLSLEGDQNKNVDRAEAAKVETTAMEPVQNKDGAAQESAPAPAPKKAGGAHAKATDAADDFDDVPALKPLEGEEGIGVDEYYALDSDSTAPLPVETETHPIPITGDPREKAASAPAKPAAKPARQSLPSLNEDGADDGPKREIQLPSLTGSIPAVDGLSPVKQNASRDKKAELTPSGLSRDLLPSLSKGAGDGAEKSSGNKLLSNAGTFDVGQATGTFAPITDEDLLEANKGEDSLYVYDADDRVYQEELTAGGVVADEGYVDMPQSHAESVFGRMFRKNKKKKKKDAQGSFSDSIGVNDNWNAREAGSELGTWDEYDKDSWNGGAVIVGGDEPAEVPAEVQGEEAGYAAPVPAATEDPREEIYQFSTNDISGDVWFVNLGAQYASGAGMAQFLADFGPELGDATFVVIEALGDGDLSIIGKSGCFKRVETGARQKRFARNAARNLSVSLKTKENLPIDGIESALQKKKVIHIAGMGADLPKNLHSMADDAENVSDENLQISSNFLMELLREI